MYFKRIMNMLDEEFYSRKIQKTGGSTYTIALPIDWIRMSDLEKGDTVVIYPQQEGNLLVMSEDKKREASTKEVEININEILDINLVLRKIVSKYLSGYRLIKLFDKDGIDFEFRTKIEQFTANLMGVEIVEESNHWIQLKDLTSLESLDLNQLIHRTHVLADKMFKNALESFFTLNKESARLVSLQEPSVDRLYFLVSRQLNAILSDLSYCSYLGIKMVQVMDYKLVIKRLEAIGDHAYGIAQAVMEMDTLIENKTLLNEIKSIGSKVRDSYNNAMGCFFNTKVLEANDIANNKPVLQKDIQALYHKITKIEHEHLLSIILLIRSFERINSYAADIAEAVINSDRD